MGGLEPGSGINQLPRKKKQTEKNKNESSIGRQIKRISSGFFFYHFFAQKSQSGVEVGRLVGQQAVGVVPAAAQVVLDHGFLHVHPLHFSPGAAARVQQAAQALRQRGQTLDAGHPSQRAVRGFTVHRSESYRANRGRSSH